MDHRAISLKQLRETEAERDVARAHAATAERERDSAISLLGASTREGVISEAMRENATLRRQVEAVEREIKTMRGIDGLGYATAAQRIEHALKEAGNG